MLGGMRLSNQRNGEPLAAKYQCLWTPTPTGGTEPIGSWRFPAFAFLDGGVVRYEFSFNFLGNAVNSWFSFEVGPNPIDGTSGFLVKTDFQSGDQAFNIFVPGLRWLEPLTNTYFARGTFQWAGIFSTGPFVLFQGPFDLFPAPEWWTVDVIP